MPSDAFCTWLVYQLQAVEVPKTQAKPDLLLLCFFRQLMLLLSIGLLEGRELWWQFNYIPRMS